MFWRAVLDSVSAILHYNFLVKHNYNPSVSLHVTENPLLADSHIMQILDWKKGRFQKAILDCRRVALKNAVETTAKKNQTIRCWDQAKP